MQTEKTKNALNAQKNLKSAQYTVQSSLPPPWVLTQYLILVQPESMIGKLSLLVVALIQKLD